MSTVTQDATTIEIKNATYAVEGIPAGEFGRAAVRVTKLVNGDSYDVLRTHDDHYECTCPDFEARHRGLPTLGCKHIQATRAAGFFTTPADVKRARYFGLTIPAPAKAPAKAPVVQPAREPVAVEADDADLDPSGDSWDTWVEDDAHWNLGPEAEPIEPEAPGVDLSTFTTLEPVSPTKALADRLWHGETVALLLTASAVEAIEEVGDASDEVDLLWLGLEEENKEAFRSFLRMLDGQATGWWTWLALCVQGSRVSFPAPAPEPRPTWSPRREATPAERAEASALLNANATDYFVINPRRARSIHQSRPVEIREIHHAELAEAGGIFAARCC